MNVAQAVGTALATEGVDHVFGVVGSGNFHVTNAMIDAGATFVAARHEGGAATMADAYARISGRVSAVSVHQGCGLTNATTGIAEAAKSRTPMLVLAAEANSPLSNFHIDQDQLVRSVGAVTTRITSPETAVAEALAAMATAVHDRRTVLLNLPLEVQDAPAATARPASVLAQAPSPPRPSAAELDNLVEALRHARRPVFVAGRGARGPRARIALEALADRTGALLATSAVAKGLFHGNPWSLDVAGGFSSPLAAELIGDADLIVGWGCALNMWTMRHGRLIADGTTTAQVDIEPGKIGFARAVDLGVVADVAETARAAAERLSDVASGYRDDRLRERIAAEIRWRDVPYADTSTQECIDPRTLTIALDDLLPQDRIIGVDSGNFMGYPSMFLSVPDENGFCFTQAFQSVGLGLATAIGAALARPDRLPVAALGDGGALMGLAELETVVRLGLPMVIVVYNDAAYGAEVHHFGPAGATLDTVRFPETDFASMASGFGFESIVVRTLDDLRPLKQWLAGDRSSPILIDARIPRDRGSWWLEEAFRAH